MITNILLAIFFATSGQASMKGDDFVNIAEKSWVKYTSAQEKWHHDLADLVTQTNPKFKENANIERDLQLIYIKERTLSFRYLLKHNPHRIVLTKGIFEFANFEWTDADMKVLTQTTPMYGQLRKQITELTNKIIEEPDGPAFRKWFHDTFSKDKNYVNLLNAFLSKVKEVEIMLKEYKPE
jgi:hypothetical protein